MNLPFTIAAGLTALAVHPDGGPGIAAGHARFSAREIGGRR